MPLLILSNREELYKKKETEDISKMYKIYYVTANFKKIKIISDSENDAHSLTSKLGC